MQSATVAQSGVHLEYGNAWARPSGLQALDIFKGSSGETHADLFNNWHTYDEDVAMWGYTAPEVVTRMLMAQFDGRYLSSDFANLKVLDAGAGSGLVGLALSSRGFRHFTAIDASSSMLNATADKIGVYQREKMHVCDLNERLSFVDDVFDVTISVGALDYCAPTGVLDELARVTAPGGILAFTVPTDKLGAWDAAKSSLRHVADELYISDSMPLMPRRANFEDKGYVAHLYRLR